MVVGYLHRSMEKLAEERTYTQNIPFTDRMDYLAAMTGNLGYCLAVEKLAGIEVPERAQYLRVIFAELQRIASHCMANGTFINDCGAWQTPVMYMFREREKILDLFEMTCGARLTTNYMRIGGVAFDIPDEFLPALDRLVNDDLPDRIRGVRAAARRQRDHPDARARRRRRHAGDGDQRLAQRPDAARRRHRLGHPQGRPVLRLRPHRRSTSPSATTATATTASSSASRRCSRACASSGRRWHELPGGPHKTDVPLALRPPAGEAYSRIESPKGELGFYVVSDGGPAPYRWHVRAPSLINLSVLKEMTVGQTIADAIVTLGSIDINVGEIDR